MQIRLHAATLAIMAASAAVVSAAAVSAATVSAATVPTARVVQGHVSDTGTDRPGVVSLADTTPPFPPIGDPVRCPGKFEGLFCTPTLPKA